MRKCEMCGNHTIVKTPIEGGRKSQFKCSECDFTYYETVTVRPPRRQSAYERTRAAVHATGNKWAIENFHATHD